MSQILDISPTDLSGVFESDYVEIVRKFNMKPFSISKFGLPLPPLPTPPTALGNAPPQLARSAEHVSDSSKSSSRAGSGGQKRSSAASSLQPLQSSQILLNGISESNTNINGNVPDSNGLGESNGFNSPAPVPLKSHPKRPGSGKNKDGDTSLDVKKSQQLDLGPRPHRRKSHQPLVYTSRFKYTPTIAVENDEDDEVYKIEVRGWKLPHDQMDVLCAIIPACSTITNLTFWNCGFTASHYKSLSQLLVQLTVNVRVLNIDQNGPVPESCISHLFAEDAGIKTLSLRGNNINDSTTRQIGLYLRTNRIMTNLDLFDNKIGREGAEALAEALKLNASLQILNLGRNHVGNEGAIAFSKALSNLLLSAEELQNRRKQLAELERIRQEIEEDASKKKGARPVLGRGASAKDDKKEDPKQKRGSKLPTKKDLPTARQKTPEDNKLKKATSAVADDKKGKDKKGGLTTKSAKKGKSEEASKDDQDDGGDSAPIPDPMFEVNGSWFVVGNRSLNSLNLVHNHITEVGLKALYDAVNDQESTTDQLVDGLIGMFRISLSHNGFLLDHPMHAQLQSLLNSRNPFFEDSHDIDPIGMDQDDTESNLEENLS